MRLWSGGRNCFGLAGVVDGSPISSKFVLIIARVQESGSEGLLVKPCPSLCPQPSNAVSRVRGMQLRMVPPVLVKHFKFVEGRK